MRRLNGQLYQVVVRSLLIAALFALIVTFLFSTTRTNAVANPLQIGWWSSMGAGKSQAAMPAQNAAGESMVVAYYAPNSDEYLTMAQQQNIKVYLQINQTLVSAGDTAGVVAFVNNYKSNPAIIGWLLADEPDFNGISSATMVTMYNAIKAVDPTHPIAIVFGDGWCSYFATLDANYYNALDIVMWDKYPVKDQPEFQPLPDVSFDEYAHEVSDCVSYLAARGRGQKFMQVAQGFNWGGTGPNGLPNRDPTYGEERFFTYYPLVEKTSGLLYWVDYQASASLTTTINIVLKEASSLGAMLQFGVSNDPSVQVNQSVIHYKYGSDGTNLFLVAVNNSTGTVTAQFSLPASVTVNAATLVYDGFNPSTQTYQSRSIPLSTDAGGSKVFSDTFTQYQVHIYQLGGTGMAGTPTSTATATATPTATQTIGAGPSPTATSSPTRAPSTATATKTATVGASPTSTATATASATATGTQTGNPGPSPTNTATATATSTATVTQTMGAGALPSTTPTSTVTQAVAVNPTQANVPTAVPGDTSNSNGSPSSGGNTNSGGSMLPNPPLGSLTGVVLAYRLNVRMGPGINFERIGRLTYKSVVILLCRNRRGTWFQVQLTSNRKAWVSAPWVRVRRVIFRQVPICS